MGILRQGGQGLGDQILLRLGAQRLGLGEPGLLEPRILLGFRLGCSRRRLHRGKAGRRGRTGGGAVAGEAGGRHVRKIRLRFGDDAIGPVELRDVERRQFLVLLGWRHDLHHQDIEAVHQTFADARAGPFHQLGGDLLRQLDPPADRVLQFVGALRQIERGVQPRNRDLRRGIVEQRLDHPDLAAVHQLVGHRHRQAAPRGDHAGMFRRARGELDQVLVGELRRLDQDRRGDLDLVLRHPARQIARHRRRPGEVDGELQAGILVGLRQQCRQYFAQV